MHKMVKNSMANKHTLLEQHEQNIEVIEALDQHIEQLNKDEAKTTKIIQEELDYQTNMVNIVKEKHEQKQEERSIKGEEKARPETGGGGEKVGSNKEENNFP